MLLQIPPVPSQSPRAPLSYSNPSQNSSLVLQPTLTLSSLVFQPNLLPVSQSSSLVLQPTLQSQSSSLVLQLTLPELGFGDRWVCVKRVIPEFEFGDRLVGVKLASRMPRIRLALGRRHQHRLRLVYAEQATAKFPGVPMVCVSRTTPPQLADSANKCRFQFVTLPGVPMVCVSRTTSQLADSANKCWFQFVTLPGCLVSPDSHRVLVRSAVREKKVLSSVSNAGVPIVCVSQTKFSSLSDSSKNCALPFFSHSVTAPVPHFIFGTFGGSSRSFSIHAGTNGVDNIYDDEVTEHNLDDCSDLPFEIKIGDGKKLCERISIEKGYMASKISEFEQRYNEFVRPLLVSRCLIAPEDLSHHSTVFLHRQTFQIANHNPKYLSAFDIMAHESGMTDDGWDMFMDYLVRKKVYVIEDWKLSMSKIQILLYDHGIIGPQDDTGVEFCKGECDASYDGESYSLAFIIWRGDEIIYSQIFKNVSCKSVTEAEFYAAFALISKAKELGIQKLLLCSDCVTVCDVLSGEHCIQNVEPPSSAKDQREQVSSSKIQNVEAPSSVAKDQRGIVSSSEKEYNQLVLYLMLRSMKRHFTNLVSMWKPRELMIIADDLAKADEKEFDEPYFIKQALKKWSDYLKGLPVFRIEWTEYTKNKIAKFGKVHLDESHGINTASIFYVAVEDMYKFDCLSGVIHAFEPNQLVLLVKDIAGKVKKYPGFFEQLGDFVDLDFESRYGNCSEITYSFDEVIDKSLVVIFDASIAKDFYYDKTVFHIVFVTAEERNTIEQMNIAELSALSFIYFKGVRFPLNEPSRKDKGDIPKKNVEQRKGELNKT